MYGSTEPLQPTPELRCATLAPVLAMLTTLCKLAVHDICIVTPRELWRALGGLSALEDLRLTFCQVCAVLPALRVHGADASIDVLLVSLKAVQWQVWEYSSSASTL